MDIKNIASAYIRTMSDFESLTEENVHVSKYREFVKRRNVLILAFNEGQQEISAQVNDFIKEFTYNKRTADVTIYVEGIEAVVEYKVQMKEDTNIDEIFYYLYQEDISSQVHIMESDKYFLSPFSLTNQVITDLDRRLSLDNSKPYFDIWDGTEKKYVDQGKVLPHTYFLGVKEKFR